MKAVLLDGSPAGDSTGKRIGAVMIQQLQLHNWNVDHIVLRDRKIGNCAGDFFCWIRSPGVCNIDDDNRLIAKAIIESDLVIYLTPVTFGGYSSTLKRMVDHQIQNVLPFFAKIEGETHHQKRYHKYPDFMAIGWMDTQDVQAEAVFKYLTQRNAINMHAGKYTSGVIIASQSDQDIQASVQTWFDELRKGTKFQAGKLPQPSQPGHVKFPVQRALLLVGSPRTKRSTSQSLGGYLLDCMIAHSSVDSVQTEIIYLQTVMRSPEKIKALLDAVDSADLVTLASPLYVDSLPAPVIEALEHIAAYRAGQRRSKLQLFTVIANCGFPEVEHNKAAIAICETFARQAGFIWGGSLALGAGEGMVHGAPLNEMDGRAIPLKQALNLAAEALINGEPIPQEAQEILDKPFIPSWVYLLLGGFGWKRQAKQYGVQNRLRRHPYQETRT